MIWKSRRHVAAFAFVVILFATVVTAEAQPEYRAFWVDTFNTALNNHADVVTVVNQAKAANANAIFAQVRRRGDAWYLNSLEPLPDPNPIAAGFDPLQDLISEGHAAGLEIHAFVIIGAVWNRNPVSLGPPASPNHVFNLHGGFDPFTGTITQGPDNWLTRTLLSGFAFQGHRFGNDFWMEPGHPDAAAYTVDVLMHLVANYDIDGLHLDRIRYPEFTASGQTPANGTNIGYNYTNIARFNRRYGITPDDSPPATGDTRWTQWRRDQVTNLVRRIYLNAIALKPHLKVSAALIAFGGGPAAETSWPTASEAHWRVYQDWRSWTEEGILDLAIPMNYKREHIATQQTQFNQWLEWTRNHQYGRAALIGQGAFVNGIEGTLRQVRRSLAPSATTGNKVDGVIFFSMATSNVFTNNGATVPVPLSTPYSIPPDQFTPTRSFDEFASGLTTGKSVDGFTLYEDPLVNPVPVFSAPVAVPVHPWKANPQVGHLKGAVKTEGGAAVDTGAIRIEWEGADAPAGRTLITNATDGGGFYGGVDLVPGTYRVTVTPVGEASYTSCATTAVVTAGGVSTLDVIVDRALPATTLTADPSQLWPPKGQQVTVNISGDATDVGTGVSSIAVRIVDEYGEVEPLVPAVAVAGAPFVRWSRQVQLQASRHEEDLDGRTYTIEVTVTDGACNTKVATTTVVVPHDRRIGGQ